MTMLRKAVVSVAVMGLLLCSVLSACEARIQCRSERSLGVSSGTVVVAGETPCR